MTKKVYKVPSAVVATVRPESAIRKEFMAYLEDTNAPWGLRAAVIAALSFCANDVLPQEKGPPARGKRVADYLPHVLALMHKRGNLPIQQAPNVDELNKVLTPEQEVINEELQTSPNPDSEPVGA